MRTATAVEGSGLRGCRRGGLAPAAGLALLVAASALAAGCVKFRAEDGGVVMGGSLVVEEGEVARDDLVALGGTIRVDGEARGDVVVIGGALVINGTAHRDAVVVGGSMRLGPGARVRGDAVVVGGGISRDPSAVVEGELVNIGLALPAGGILAWAPLWPGGWWGINPFRIIGRTTQLLYWLLLAVLTVALVGDKVAAAGRAAAREPLRLGAIGLVGFVALCLVLLLLVLLSVVLIGLPFLVALILAWWLAYVFGVVAVFQVIGDKVLRAFGRPEASQVAVVLVGGMLLGILRYFPLFGTLLWWIAALVGLGTVFATRFGTGQPWFRRATPA